MLEAIFFSLRSNFRFFKIIFAVYSNFTGQDEKFMCRLLCQLTVVTENRPQNVFLSSPREVMILIYHERLPDWQGT